MSAQFKASIDAQTLYRKLIAIPEGGSVTYSDLSAEIGRDVQGVGRSALDTARRMAIREDRIVYGVERGIGLIRLDDKGIVDSSYSRLLLVKRTLRNQGRVAICVKDFDALPNDYKVRQNATLSVCGALAQALTSKGMAKVEQAVQSNSALPLPLKKTLDAFTR